MLGHHGGLAELTLSPWQGDPTAVGCGRPLPDFISVHAFDFEYFHGSCLGISPHNHPCVCSGPGPHSMGGAIPPAAPSVGLGAEHREAMGEFGKCTRAARTPEDHRGMGLRPAAHCGPFAAARAGDCSDPRGLCMALDIGMLYMLSSAFAPRPSPGTQILSDHAAQLSSVESFLPQDLSPAAETLPALLPGKVRAL